jgi:hypothetical protein
MRILYLTAAILAATSIGASPATAQRGWTLIGSKTVDGARDRDVIAVRGAQRFTQIKLCTVNRPIRLNDFSVRFANGGQQDIATRSIIERGSCTRNVDLKGNRRDIQSVMLSYQRANVGFLPPLVRVYAR